MKFTDIELSFILKTKRVIQIYINEMKFSGMSQEIQDLIMNHGIITGGISASVFHDEAPKDIDIFLTNQDHIDKFKRALSIQDLDAIEDVNPKYMMDVLVNGKLVTTRATTFKNGYQVITMHTVDARKTFDFIHAMPYFDIAKDKYCISKEQYECIMKKKLKANPAGTKDVSVERLQKFIDRGWSA
jgi:hypothetical protein